MRTLPFTRRSHLAAAVEAVRDALAAHGVVAFPTETFYGLAVRPDDHAGVRRIFDLKRRPQEKALPVVAASAIQLASLVAIPETWRRRLAAAWPAALTVVLPSLGPAAAGQGTLAVRVPDHALLRELLAEVGPLTATSANRSGDPPLAAPEGVADTFGEGLALLLDGGETPGGEPSTVVDLSSGEPRLIRDGAWKPPAAWHVRRG